MAEKSELPNWCVPILGGKFKTITAIEWEIGKRGSGLMLIVPRGTEFDVSIPSALRWLINPKDPRFLLAACLHDFALSEGWGRVSSAGPFNAALRACGVNKFQRLIMVLAVIVWRWR